jgi:Diacylglycerol kinase accessory domain
METVETGVLSNVSETRLELLFTGVKADVVDIEEFGLDVFTGVDMEKEDCSSLTGLPSVRVGVDAKIGRLFQHNRHEKANLLFTVCLHSAGIYPTQVLKSIVRSQYMSQANMVESTVFTGALKISQRMKIKQSLLPESQLLVT